MKTIFFQDNAGNEPAKKFLNNLPPNVRTRFHDYLKHLVEHEGRMSGVAFKKLHGYPMEEIRVKQSKNLHRIIIHVRIKTVVFILHGFTKKEGQATPIKELEIAHERLKALLTLEQ